MSWEKVRRLQGSQVSWGRVARGLERRIRSMPRRAAWAFDPRLAANRKRLEAFRDLHRGERCVIVGNGPSLNRTDLSLLAGTPSFGLNRIYLLFDRSDFRPSYHVCFNETLIAQFAHELARVECPRFVNLATRSEQALLGAEPNYVLERFSPGFSATPDAGLWVGGTVTFVALQLAYFMGFERVVLVGVDHRFSAKGEPNKRVEATGDDSDHFDPRYFNAGKLWDLPDLETSEWAYSLARRAYEAAGRSVVDATVDGALAIFDKVDLADEMSKPYSATSTPVP